jgi:hypothetical protein
LTTRLLSSLHRATLAAEHARNVNLATNHTPVAENANAERENPTMGNEAHARGVPIMARGISGAIAGTSPDRIA